MGDLSRISYLQLEVVFLSQEDLSITKYFTKLRIISDKLENFRPNPICICQTKCSCFVALVITQRKCEDQVMHEYPLRYKFYNGKTNQINNFLRSFSKQCKR